MQSRLLVLHGEAQGAEPSAEARGVLGERDHQVPEVVGPAIRVTEDDLVVDDQRDGVGDSQAPQGVADLVDDHGRLDRDAGAVRREVEPAAKGLFCAFPERRGALDRVAGEGDVDGRLQTMRAL